MIRFLKRKKVIPYTFIIIFICLSLFPMYWMLMSSFKGPDEITKMPPTWFPKPTLKNIVEVFKARPFLKYTLNSLIVAITVSALSIILGAPAAYGFSRFKFIGNRVMFLAIIASRLFPPVAFLVPFTMIFNKLGIMDTKIALIIAYLFFNLPFVVWILIGFFDGIPSELDESARVDGCNKIQAFWYILLPLAKPGMVAGGILAFIMSWNEFMFALAFTRTNAKTLPIGITDFYADNFIVWNKVMSASLYSTIPAIIFVLFFQRHLIKGMIGGAVKG